MRDFNDDGKSDNTLVSEEQHSMAPTSSTVQFDMNSGTSSRSGFVCLAPSFQDHHQEQQATHHPIQSPGAETMTIPSQAGNDESKVASMHESNAIRREEDRERLYQEWIKLAKATHQLTSNTTESNTADPTTIPLHRRGGIRRGKGREVACQEKMKHTQNRPYPPTLVPDAERTSTIEDADLTGKKMQSLAIRDPSRLLPGPAIALSLAKRDDLCSSLDFQGKACLESDPVDEMNVANRVSVENTKMPPLEQANSHMFDGEGLRLAPARAEIIESTMMLSPDEAARRPEQGCGYSQSDQCLLDEKRRMIEGARGLISKKQFCKSIDWERESKHAGKPPSESPTKIQVDKHVNHRNRARAGEMTLTKKVLSIDPRTSPLEHNKFVDENAVIETSDIEEQLAAQSASTGNTGWVPPLRQMRTPAEGYTVHAGNKGPHNHATTPGAIAVDQRGLGARRANSNDSEEYCSTRGDALSTSQVQGCENALLAWVACREKSYPNIPPEMRESAGRLRVASFGRRVSSCSLEDQNDEKSGTNTRAICIVIGIFILLLALGTGLGVGLGGKDDPSSGAQTDAPTLPLNISYFKSLVEDFYDDDGTVFDDTNSPQHQALVWLASDPLSESLDVDRIRTLYALAVFYYNTNGDDFMSYPTWSERFGFLNSTSENICKWNNGDGINSPQGLWCDSTETKVERLYLSTNNLVGAIPEEIGMLTDLQYLLLAENSLTSTLPNSLFALSTLKGVNVNQNSLTGLIPSTFAEATSLEVFHLGTNSLHGPIPLDHLVESIFCPLQLVVLEGNSFTGTFPLESIAANCTDVSGININNCRLVVEGSIPSMGLEQLTVLDLSGTKLGGSIPDEISRLRRLQQFTAENNLLTGSLPASLGELIALTDISLGGNMIKGTIPSALGQLRQLKTLGLQSNSLDGNIPSELALCTNLINVKLQLNFLSGEIDFFCPLSLEFLSSDCNGDIVCTCCNECY